MSDLLLRPQAQLDIADSADWYEDRRTGLGVHFLADLDHILSRVRLNPFQFPEIDAGVRRGLLRRFPYSVYFVVGASSIEVIAVLHQHRHPDAWRSR